MNVKRGRKLKPRLRRDYKEGQHRSNVMNKRKQVDELLDDESRVLYEDHEVIVRGNTDFNIKLSREQVKQLIKNIKEAQNEV